MKLAPAVVLTALALPGSAFGLPNRGWVSGTGDDANSCIRTAPCKTFAGALAKTAAGGVIRCLDPGGYGTLSITKSIAIKCSDREGGILTAGTFAIMINAAVTDKVTLKGLDLKGTGVGLQTAGIGVRVVSAASVHIVDSEVSRFKSGVWADPGGSPGDVSTRVVVADSHIHDNGMGLYNGPDVYAEFSSLTARNDLIADNICGIATSSSGSTEFPPNAHTSECGAGSGAPFRVPPAVTSIYGNGIYDNGEGVFVTGVSALALVAYNRITGNSSFGMHRRDSGTLQTFTPATNVIVNNAATDPPNSVIAQTKRAATKNR